MSKAEDLMIGDWLFYKGPFNAFPFKVEQITKNKVGYHAEPNESRIYYVRLCECYPIPLTPEILEKNGFRKMKWKSNAYVNSESEAAYICFSIGDYTNLWGGGDQDYVWITVKHVHQLQHALRLCGIKKDIQL